MSPLDTSVPTSYILKTACTRRVSVKTTWNWNNSTLRIALLNHQLNLTELRPDWNQDGHLDRAITKKQLIINRIKILKMPSLGSQPTSFSIPELFLLFNFKGGVLVCCWLWLFENQMYICLCSTAGLPLLCVIVILRTNYVLAPYHHKKISMFSWIVVIICPVDVAIKLYMLCELRVYYTWCARYIVCVDKCDWIQLLNHLIAAKLNW